MMASYAEIDSKNPITAHSHECFLVMSIVVVGDENEGKSEDMLQREILGLQWLKEFPPTSGKVFVKTSYDVENGFRKNYAGPGMLWCPALDGFISKSPYPSWTLNEKTCQFEAPSPRPDDGKVYFWDELLQLWLEE